MERMRRKRIRTTAGLILLLLVLLCGGGFLVYTLKGGMMKPLDQPYSVVKEFSNPLVSGKRQRVDLFAKNLCVVEGNVPLESAALESGQRGLLLDLTRKDVLYAQDAFARIYPASITKIMTAMLALKNGNMEDIVTITDEDVNLEEGAQVCGFQPGDQVTMEQLLNCLLVYSGNDAASPA